MIAPATRLLQEMNNLGLVYCCLTTVDFLRYCLTTEFVINSPSQRNEHKRNKAHIYDGMVQIYFSVFDARRNYIVHRLSRDFEVLLCPDWIRFAQSG